MTVGDYRTQLIDEMSELAARIVTLMEKQKPCAYITRRMDLFRAKYDELLTLTDHDDDAPYPAPIH